MISDSEAGSAAAYAKEPAPDEDFWTNRITGNPDDGIRGNQLAMLASVIGWAWKSMSLKSDDVKSVALVRAACWAVGSVTDGSYIAKAQTWPVSTGTGAGGTGGGGCGVGVDQLIVMDVEV